jgi:histone H3/H4
MQPDDIRSIARSQGILIDDETIGTILNILWRSRNDTLPTDMAVEYARHMANMDIQTYIARSLILPASSYARHSHRDTITMRDIRSTINHDDDLSVLLGPYMEVPEHPRVSAQSLMRAASRLYSMSNMILSNVRSPPTMDAIIPVIAELEIGLDEVKGYLSL